MTIRVRVRKGHANPSLVTLNLPIPHHVVEALVPTMKVVRPVVSSEGVRLPVELEPPSSDPVSIATHDGTELRVPL